MALKIHPNKHILLKRLMLKKGKTMQNKQEEIDKEDIISKLPAEILVSIMCMLRTEEAAKMSVVSRLWRRIWITTIRVTPRLTIFLERESVADIAPCDLSKKIRDINKKMSRKIIEVYRVLKLHKAPTLYEFSLMADLTYKDCHHIDAWLDFAAKKHVQKLVLDIPSVMVYDAMFVANNFHSLRDLTMEGISVTENFIDRLFSNSPFLERFVLLASNKLDRLSIAFAPNLKYLQIESSERLQHLQISSAENLNTIIIKFIDEVNFESVNISAPNLSHISFAIFDDGFKFDSFVTVLNQIKRLAIEVYTDAISAQLPQILKLSKLEHLELTLGHCSIIPFHCLLDILKAAPFSITFSSQDQAVLAHPAKDNALKWLDMHIPKEVEVNQNHSCQCLKVVKWGVFAGCQSEVEFLLHLLEYAVSVEKIFIELMDLSYWRDREHWRGCNYDDQYEELCVECARLLRTKILQMHPRAEVIIT
ncbi:F-box/LRR-repeat protein At3g03360 isoform X1 [Ziziphus jujuba]|uniref:F-box/LRR-repeat protein At3g03360 isoform X1 n=2 Tax=Ziziphus jujuba TaxID=326968 RepID=A0ABM3I522_ZIZJJ|nr:F-box/LRR-repeat protein At3g03360 isoform X1 [Ziziphus jujuba]XP_048320754.2 F-box/LRR-repeat protein At3g03360 isoform X1 [Ziziphus jujuba]